MLLLTFGVFDFEFLGNIQAQTQCALLLPLFWSLVLRMVQERS
jgi:hypothetical protein